MIQDDNVRGQPRGEDRVPRFSRVVERLKAQRVLKVDRRGQYIGCGSVAFIGAATLAKQANLGSVKVFYFF